MVGMVRMVRVTGMTVVAGRGMRRRMAGVAGRLVGAAHGDADGSAAALALPLGVGGPHAALVELDATVVARAGAAGPVGERARDRGGRRGRRLTGAVGTHGADQ